MDLTETKIAELDISFRMKRFLREMDIKDLDAICKKFIRKGGNYRKISWPGFGEKMHNEMKELLESKGLLKELTFED